MKTFIIIVATAAITLLAANLVRGARVAYERTWFPSAVKAPGRMAIEAIQKDLNEGRVESAKAKVEVLSRAWKDFSLGPDSFRGVGIGDIMARFAELEKGDAENGAKP